MRMISLSALFMLAISIQAAPGLPEKPPKWEYAEVSYRNFPARPAGVSADGLEIPATPPSMMIRWITVTGEVEMKGWAEFAEKLKAANFKKDGSVVLQKIQILNLLGSEGWELIEQQQPTASSAFRGDTAPGGRGAASSTTSTWLFKRRSP